MRLSTLIDAGIRDHLNIRKRGNHDFNLYGSIQKSPEGREEVCFAGGYAIESLGRDTLWDMILEQQAEVTALSIVAFNVSGRTPKPEKFPEYGRIIFFYDFLLQFSWHFDLISREVFEEIFKKYEGVWDSSNALNKLGAMTSLAEDLRREENIFLGAKHSDIFISDDLLKEAEQEPIAINNRWS